MKFPRHGWAVAILAILAGALVPAAAHATSWTSAESSPTYWVYSEDGRKTATAGPTYADCSQTWSGGSWYCQVHASAKDERTDGYCARTKVELKTSDYTDSPLFSATVTECTTGGWESEDWYVTLPEKPYKLTRWVGTRYPYSGVWTYNDLFGSVYS